MNDAGIGQQLDHKTAPRNVPNLRCSTPRSKTKMEKEDIDGNQAFTQSELKYKNEKETPFD